MRRRWYYILGVICCAIALAYVFFRPPAEPSFEGRTLSEWLDFRGQLRVPAVSPKAALEGHEAFTNAVAHMGTDAIPYLLESAQYDVKPWQTATLNFLRKHWQNGIVTRRFANWIAQHNKRIQPAVKALASLGPRAESAIPQLVASLENTNRLFAPEILAGIGEKSARPLALALTNAASMEGIIFAMQFLGSNAVPAIPLLIQNLQSTNTQLAERSAAVLRRISPSVIKRPLTELKDLAIDPRPQFRRERMEAIQALACSGGREARATLIATLDDPDPALQTAVSNSLHTMDILYGKPQSISERVSELVSPTNK